MQLLVLIVSRPQTCNFTRVIPEIDYLARRQSDAQALRRESIRQEQHAR